jgi:predicted TIM-barrel enzyme
MGDIMHRESREQILERFRRKVAEGRPIIGGGAGTGLSAKCAEAGGIDLLIIYNSGRYRMAGRGSLAGFLAEVRDLGFAGVQNFPTVGLIDGVFRQGLEETGMGFDKEVTMIAHARAMDLLTCPYVHNEDEARAMAQAGADILVPHMGLTTKGLIGARTTIDLSSAAGRVQKMADAAWSIRADVLVLCHGGPIAEPADVAEILRTTRGIAGFFGASSIERLPTEPAIIAQVRAFESLRLGPA